MGPISNSTTVHAFLTILTEFGVENRLEKEDYLQGLKNLQNLR